MAEHYHAVPVPEDLQPDFAEMQERVLRFVEEGRAESRWLETETPVYKLTFHEAASVIRGSVDTYKSVLLDPPDHLHEDFFKLDVSRIEALVTMVMEPVSEQEYRQAIIDFDTEIWTLVPPSFHTQNDEIVAVMRLRPDLIEYHRNHCPSRRRRRRVELG